MKYIIDSENQYYNTLSELKNHIWVQSDKDKQGYNGASILCFKGSKYTGHKEIKVTRSKIVFSHTIKAQSWE